MNEKTSEHRIAQHATAGPGTRAASMVRRIARWLERHPLVSLALTVLVALGLGGMLSRIEATSIGSNLWWDTALNLASGKGYVSCDTSYFPFCSATNQVTAAREPVPVLLLAGVALLSHGSINAAVPVQVAVNLAIVVATFLLACELADFWTALLAALLWALYLPAPSLYREIGGDLVATLLLTCAFIWFLRARRANRSRDWLTAGVLFGLAALSRSAALAVAAALAAGLLWPGFKGDDREQGSGVRGQGSGTLWHHTAAVESQTRLTPLLTAITRFSGGQLRAVALFVITLALAVSPWVVRNELVFGRLVLGSTLTGYDLYRSNALLPGNNYLHFVARQEAEDVIADLVAHQTAVGANANEAETDAMYRVAAIQLIATHPVQYLILSASRFLMLWFDWTVNDAYGDPNHPLIILQQVLLLIGAALGASLVWRRDWPLVFGVVVFSLEHMLVISRLRFVIPIMPAMVVLSALAVTSLVRRWRGMEG